MKKIFPNDPVEKRIGYQALFDFEDAFEAIEFGIKYGFTCVELNQTNPSFFPENYSAIQRKRIRDYEFPILLHAPEGLSLFNLHKKALNGTLKRLCEIINFGTDINAKTVTLHLGSTFLISVDGKMIYIHEIIPQQYETTLKYALIELAEYSKDRVPVCIENTAGFRYEISHKVLEELLDTQNLWLTWDIAHTNRIEDKGKVLEEKFFLKYLNKVKEVHLHDNHGGWDEHGIPGTGTVDFNHYFEILKEVNPYFIIEVRPKERAIKSLEAIKKLLF
ncbi:MAG: sugar phosphate isomerase/epimerase [bacterium]|nr:sugar phosphate isomerase/epimerase [bacterium]